jgi:hypothetical protein
MSAMIRGMRLPTLELFSLAVGAFVLSGCFGPDYGVGGFLCGKDECPEGYRCVEVDNSDEPGTRIEVCRADAVTGGDPQVTISAVQPEPNNRGVVVVQKGEELVLSFGVKNFRFAPEKAGEAPEEGEGHLHLYLDEVPPGGYLEPPVLQLQRTLTIDDRFSLGDHTVIAALTQNNHQLILPLITAELQIRVVPGGF